MRLGSTTLSVTQPGRRRRAGAGVVSGGGGGGNAQGGGGGTTYFTDIDDYSFTRFDKINIGGTTDPCTSVRFKPDGTVVYTLDWNPSGSDPTIRQQSLSTAWDISTHGSTTATLSPGANFPSSYDFEFKPDGTQLWLLDGQADLVMYNLSTAWDISTATLSNDTLNLGSGCVAIFWKPDGTSLYEINTGSDKVSRLNFSTAWDITSSYTTQQSVALDLSTTANESNPRGMYLSPDGLKLYITGYGTDDVFMYNLSTAWDITSFSGVYDSILDTTPQESIPLGLTFSPDGLYMYLVGNGSDGVNQYTRQSSPPSNSIVTTNLALHVDAGDTNSYSGTGTTWTDLTSNSNNVTLVNGPTFSNGAIIFDGTNDFATLSSTITFTDHTVEVWIYHTSPNVANDYGYITTNATHGLAVSEGGYFGLPNGELYYNNGGAAILLNTTLSSNVWTHLVAVGDSSTNSLKLYLNGSLASTTSVTSLATSITRFAHFQGNGGLSLNAKLAQIRVYDDQLTAAEVLQNYNATKDTFGVVTTNLVMHVDAGDTNSYSGTGTTWSDLTSNSNDFTLINGPVYSSSTDGGVFTFDFADDRAETSNTVTLSGDFSFDAWVNTGSGQNTVFSIGNFNLASGLSIVTGSTGTAYYVQVATNNVTVYNGSLIASPAWAHIALVRSGSTNTVYLNGTSIATYTNSATLSGNLYLGARDSSTSSGFQNHLGGKYSNARLYDAALSAAEVTQNYDALVGRF